MKNYLFVSKKRFTLVKLLLLICILLVNYNSYSSTIRTISLSKLSTQATDIFRGELVGFEPYTVTYKNQSMVATKYVFSVAEMLKGEANNGGGSLYEFVMVGSPSSQVHLLGFPRFEYDKEYVIYMGKPSKIGLSAPIALVHGVFEKNIGSNNEEMFMNGTGNRGLMDNETSTYIASDVTLEKSSGPESTQQQVEGLSYKEMKSVVISVQ